MTGEIERIAASLTEAQREAVLGKRTPKGGALFHLTYGSHPLMAYRRLNALENELVLTPLGEQARAHLEQHHA